VSAKPQVLEFGMGVDVHGRDATKAACRAYRTPSVIRACPLFGGPRAWRRMIVDVTVAVPDPASVDVDV